MRQRNRSLSRTWISILAGVVALTGCQPQPPAEPEKKVYVRREINQFQADDPLVVALKKGIEVMQNRPDDDPTSWIYQANIHGIPVAGKDSGKICEVTPGEPQEAWVTCQHGTWFFLSWHRMYLHFFERILRAASGYEDFALPFWDYEQPDHHALPEIFRNPADSSNPLYVAERAPGMNDGTNRLTEEDVSTREAMKRIPFFVRPPTPANLSFGSRYTPKPAHDSSAFGQLESQPHNLVHVAVGGDDGWMAWVECAARDPIFWLHHANIDRLWQVWLDQGGARKNPIDQEEWMQLEFTFFDERGEAVKMSGKEILNTVTQLDYRYEGVAAEVPAEEPPTSEPPPSEPQTVVAPPVAEEAAELTHLAVIEQPVALGRKSQTVRIGLPPAAGQKMLSMAGAQQKPPLLIIEGLQLERPGAFYRLYLNLPEGQEPDPKSIYYVGNIALFSTARGDREHEVEGAQLAFDISEQLRALGERGEWTGEIALTFVKGGPAAEEGAEEPVYIQFHRVTLSHQ